MKRRNLAKAAACFLTAAVMLLFFSGSGAEVSAADTVGSFTVEGGTQGADYSYSSGSVTGETLTIRSGKPLTISTSGSVTGQIAIAPGVAANLTLDGVDIVGVCGASTSQSAIEIPSGSSLTLTLSDGTSNSLTGGGNSMNVPMPGIHVPSGAMLTIEGDTGALDVTGGSDVSTSNAVGIGGKNANGPQDTAENCGTVIIQGGNVHVKGGSLSSSQEQLAIGGGYSPIGAGGDGGTIIILGKNVDLPGGLGASNNNGNPGTGIKPGVSGGFEVYGDLTLPADITVPAGASVSVSDGASLTIPAGTKLTNNGTINGNLTNNGTLCNPGVINGTVSGTGTIEKVPQKNVPAAPELSGTAASDSITIRTVAGQMYAITETADIPEIPASARAVTWQRADGDSLTFGGLKSETSYYIWTYIPGNDYYEDSQVSAALSVTTLKEAEGETGSEEDGENTPGADTPTPGIGGGQEQGNVPSHTETDSKPSVSTTTDAGERAAVKTGDEADIALWCLLALFSCLGIIGTIVIKQKR